MKPYTIPKYVITLLIFFLFLVGFSNKGRAQAYFINPFSASYFQPNFGINAGTFFNAKDLILDFGLGYEEMGYDFSATINLTFRPYYKKVFFKNSSHLYYQMQEKIWQVSIDLEKRFYLLAYGSGRKEGKIGLYVIGKFGYFWGKYKGFKENRNKAFAINPGAGISWQASRNARVNLGYLYFNQNPYAEPHMIHLKLSLFFGSKNQ